MTVAGVILAAGRGTRLDLGDVPKPLALLRGRPLVSWALDAVLAAGLAPVLLVVGWQKDAVAAVAPTGVRIVESTRYRDGIAHSVAAAVDALEGDVGVTAACIGLADQPEVGAEAHRRLAAAHETGADFVVASYDGQRANPVLVARDLWPELRALEGDVGARVLMADHHVTEVDCTSTGNPRDIDTVDDLRLLERAASREEDRSHEHS